MKYLVYNISESDISLVVENHKLKTAHSVLIPRSMVIDLLPYAGSADACRLIPGLHDQITQNRVLIVEKP